MRDPNRTNKRIIWIGGTATIVVIAATASSYLIGKATDPRTTSSVSAPALGEPENLAALPNLSGGSEP